MIKTLLGLLFFQSLALIVVGTTLWNYASIGNVPECTLQRVSPMEGIHCVIYEEKIYCNLFEYMGGDGGE